MKALFKRSKLILSGLLMGIIVLSAAYSYVYWGTPISVLPLFLDVAISDFDKTQNTVHDLPPNTPDEVIDRLDELTQGHDTEVIDSLVEAIRDIINSPEFEGNIHVAGEVNEFFEVGQPPISSGDILVYTIINDNGERELAIVYVNSNSSFVINSVDRLYEALSLAWTGVNKISNTWLSGNAYSTLNSPIQYNGRHFLMYHSGPSGVPPINERGVWFEIMPDLAHSTQNRYFTNYIVQHNFRYYIANQYATWAIPTLNPQPWDPWTLIPAFSMGQSYSVGQYAYTGSGENVRFWKALTTTLSIPNEQSARDGEWQEINNGWIGTNEGNTANIIKPYYFEHNTYRHGETVIFGVSPKLWYRYYRARQNVPSGQPPLIVDSDGVTRLNSQYWEMRYYSA